MKSDDRKRDSGTRQLRYEPHPGAGIAVNQKRALWSHRGFQPLDSQLSERAYIYQRPIDSICAEVFERELCVGDIKHTPAEFRRGLVREFEKKVRVGNGNRSICRPLRVEKLKMGASIVCCDSGRRTRAV